MKAPKIAYWVATALLALMMTFSAYAYLTQADIKMAFVRLGFPDYFRVELAIAKFLGAVVLLTPVAGRVKEWAYSGFAITFISAFVAHLAVGDPAAMWMGPVVALILLAVSYVTFHRLQTGLPKLYTTAGEYFG
jgi:DoxX-like family